MMESFIGNLFKFLTQVPNFGWASE